VVVSTFETVPPALLAIQMKFVLIRRESRTSAPSGSTLTPSLFSSPGMKGMSVPGPMPVPMHPGSQFPQLLSTPLSKTPSQSLSAPSQTSVPVCVASASSQSSPRTHMSP
jgi:hypothetical protein